MAAYVYKVSTTGIRTIEVEKLGGVAHDVQQSLFVINLSTFKGTKPTTEEAMGEIIVAFNDARTIYKQGGTGSKKDYDDAYEAIIDCLISFAPYVDEIADGDKTILTLSNLPFTKGPNQTGVKISNGAVPELLTYTVGLVGRANVSCGYFGPGAKYFAVISQGLLPAGTAMSLDGQILFPDGTTMPAHFMNVNGKRNKVIVGMTPKLDYYLYYVVSYGGVVSGLSLPLLIVCGV